MSQDKNLQSTETSSGRFYHVFPRSFRRVIKKTWLDIKHANAKDNVTPDFYIIGSMKSGTTALYMHLEDHPDIYPATRKEVHYFNTQRDLGERFFRSHFPPASKLEARNNSWGRQIVGEATPDYIFHPAAPAMCREITPDAKLILLMRNPIDRAYSHWKQGHRFGFETATFEDAIALEEERMAGAEERLLSDPHYYSYAHQLYSYLSRGYYARQISTWLKHFPKDQFLFLKAEDMFEDGTGVFRQVTDFLGVEDWTPEDFSLKFKGLEGDISPQARRKLAEHFAPHNEALATLLGRDFGWQ